MCRYFNIEYAKPAYSQVKIAKTKVKLGPDPVFDEEFELDDIPPDVLTVSVTVFNKVGNIQCQKGYIYTCTPGERNDGVREKREEKGERKGKMGNKKRN